MTEGAAAGSQARNKTFRSTHLCPCFLVFAGGCSTWMAFEVQYLARGTLSRGHQAWELGQHFLKQPYVRAVQVIS